jgi:hypothetical protein
MKYLNVLVERSEHLAVPEQVPPWVLPILCFMHGEEKVIVQGEVEVDRPVPRANPEFERLERCYGADTKTGKAFVAEIYGQLPRGAQELAKAISEATTQAEDPVA